MSKAQDPFATTSDPNLYVPRRATERALDALADAAWHQGGIAVLLGPPGVGKSLLLRVLARRAEDELHCIHVPVPTLDPEGITLWVASRLPGGRRLGGSETLLEVARERPLLLLVEDAELLPADSARAIAELHRASSGAIRAVLAVNAEVLPDTLATALEPECARVSLDEPMDRDEAVEYATRRLAAAGVPQSVAERFDAGTIATLHETSAGNPARFNTAARSHMPVAARALAPRPPESGLWQDPFPLEPAAVQETPPPRDRARRRWVWGVSWALGASAVTFAAGLLLGFWLRGSGPSFERAPERPVARSAPVLDGPTTPALAPRAVDGAAVAASPSAAAEAAATDGAPGAVAARPGASAATPSAGVATAPQPGTTTAATAAARSGPSTTSAPRVAPTASSETGAPARATSAPIGASTPTARTTPTDPPRARPAPAATVARSPGASSARRATAPPSRAAGTRPEDGAPQNAAVARSPEPAAPRSTSLPRAATPAPSPPALEPPVVAAAPRVEASPIVPAPAADRAEPSQRSAAPAPPDVAPTTTASRGRLFAPELPAELQASIVVSAEPRAFVEIDGHAFGPTPIQITGLRPGAHRLVAHFQTGETMTQELVLSSGERELTLRGPVRRPPRVVAPPAARAAPSATAPLRPVE